MRNVLLVLSMSLVMSAAAANDCDCFIYPFTPNPPCFSLCVAKLSAKPPSEAGIVRNIDPGVSVGIRVLSESKDRSAVDFNAIQGKPDLERAALKAMKMQDR